MKMSAQINLACVVFLKGEEDKAVMLLSQHLQDWVDAASHSPTAMLVARWLTTGRRGWVMLVLQCGAPADGVEGRGGNAQLWHAAQGHLPAAQAMA